MLTSLAHLDMAEARLGETLPECALRYGKQIEADGGNGAAIFSKSELTITAHFRDGSCVAIQFVHSAKDESGNPRWFTEAELVSLMNANGDSTPWRKVLNYPRMANYESMQRKATYDRTSRVLTIVTKEEDEKRRVESAAKDKSKLKDF